MIEWHTMQTGTQTAAGVSSQSLKPLFLRGIVRLAAGRLESKEAGFFSRQRRTSSGAGIGASGIEYWIDRATQVLTTNIESGRFEHAQDYLEVGPDNDATLLAYAVQVLRVLVAEAERVERLTAGQSTAWATVIFRMEQVAYRWLGPVGREDWAAWEARDATARTCADLWAWLQVNPYPFDVPFGRWATRALYNRLREAARKRRTRERYIPESLDRPLYGHAALETYGDIVADLSFDIWLERSANREALLQALERLDARQAAVIRLWYLEQWPAPEIAAALGIQVNYVYVQRFRAIEKLRQIVLSDERLGLADVLLPIEQEKRRSRPAMGEPAPQEEDPL